MIITIEALVHTLGSRSNQGDTDPSHAVWIRFGQEKTENTIEYRTGDGNQILHVYLDRGGALVGIEIFP
jgi:hypothetical protein